MELAFNYILLGIGFVFTFFICGFVFVEAFFSYLPRTIKLPLYFLLSILTSTYVVYFVSLIIGFSKISISISFLLFFIWLILIFKKIKGINFSFIKKHLLGIVLSILVFLVFTSALYPAIFFPHDGYYVMSGPNWQDTAMHASIIESISQGNFPPQAPYYSGTPLNYYYFTDFHTAILSKLKGDFFPRILVYDNPFFALIFVLSLYFLAYQVTKNKLMSVSSSFLGMFFSNWMFIKFFQDIGKPLYDANFLINIRETLANRGYSMEYNQVFQMSTMADYFLQNRPMMVGLSGVVLVISLTLFGYKNKEKKAFLLAGIIAGMFVKFQFFACGVSLLIFLLSTIFFVTKQNFRFITKSAFFFFVPLSIFLLFSFSFSQVNQGSLLELIKENIHFESWDNTKTLFWHIKFIVLSFGLPFLITILFFLKLLLRKIRGEKVRKAYVFLVILSLVLLAIPYLIRFTIYSGDMFKFFYFMVIPVSILTSLFLSKLSVKVVGLPLIFVILLSSTLTSFLTLGNSFFNKNFAYSLDDYKAGMWIRENTAQKSVFVTSPTVHSPVTEIGGRLRVLSYINWPYSHGYNTGDDNVFSRLSDIESFYGNIENKEKISQIVKKYNIDYVFYGDEEKNQFPEAAEKLDSSSYFKRVFTSKTIKIYEFI